MQEYSITGISDLDIAIFDHLQGYDLYPMCHTNDYTYQLCMNNQQLRFKYEKYQHVIQNTKLVLIQLDRLKLVKLLVKNSLKLSYFKPTKLDVSIIELSISKNYNEYIITIFFGIALYVYHCDVNELIDILNDLFYRDIVEINYNTDKSIRKSTHYLQ